MRTPNLNNILKGVRAERRFIEVCSTKTTDTPEWFMRVKQSDIPWDLRGVDAFAFFKPIDGSKRVKVPIQIKSSQRGRELFHFRKDEQISKNVFVIVVNNRRSDDEIRIELYSYLRMLREIEMRFDNILREIISEPLTHNQRFVTSKLIKRARAIANEVKD